MEPLSRLPALPDGLDCTVCEMRVPRERIRLLARRDDLAFVQSDCDACGSTSLAFLLPSDATDVAVSVVARPRPVSGDDVLDMHRFLEAWDGDLASLVGRPGGDA